MTRRRVAAWCFLFASLLVIGRAQFTSAEYADTLGLTVESRNTGNAFTASPAGMAAFHSNPAGLLLSKGRTVSLDLNFLSLNPLFYQDAEGKHHERGDMLVMPTFGFIVVNSEQTLAYGVGVGVPFGLIFRFPNNDGFQRFAGSEAALLTSAITPSIAAKVTPWLSVGAGVNIIAADHFSTRVTVGNGVVGDFATRLGIPVSTRQQGGRQDGYAVAKTRGSFDVPMPPDKADWNFETVSYNLGVIVKPRDDLKIGLTYREQATVKYRGTINFFFDPEDNLNGAVTSAERPMTVKFAIPRQVEAGAEYALSPTLEFGLGLLWTNWSDAEGWGKSTTVNVGGGGVVDVPAFNLQGLIRQLTIPHNFCDTWSPRIGLRYRIFEDTQLMAGYWYDPSPVRDRFYDTFVTSSNRHYLSFGVSQNFLKGSLTVGIGTQLVFLERRTIGPGESVNAGGLGGLNYSGIETRILGFTPNTSSNNSGAIELGGFAWTLGFNVAYRF